MRSRPPTALVTDTPTAHESLATHCLHGGHLTRHRWRLWQTLIAWALMLASISGGVTCAGYVTWRTTAVDRAWARQWLWAQVVAYARTRHARMTVWVSTPSSSLSPSLSPSHSPFHTHRHARTLTAGQVIERANAYCAQRHGRAVLRDAGWVGAGATVLSLLVLLAWLTERGRRAHGPEHVRGDTLVSPTTLKRRLRGERRASGLRLGTVQLPLVKDSACQHLLIDGTTGKSTAMRELLDQLRARGDKVLLWDEGGQLLSHYYDATQDVVLNPLDARSRAWHVWCEGTQRADCEQLAAALIPLPAQQDPFWALGARQLFSEVAFAMRDDPKRSTEALLSRVLQADLGELRDYLTGSFAQSLVADDMAKVTRSLQSVLATHLTGLGYVSSVGGREGEGDGQDDNPHERREGPSVFSVREWVRNDDDRRWVFLTAQEQHLAALRPLITAWLDTAFSALLSLAPNPNRRVWVFLDEVATLQRIPSLMPLLAKARKVGGCVVIGTQNRSQLAQVYGREGAETLSALLNTRLFFRQPDPALAAWSASNAGAREHVTPRASVTFGGAPRARGGGVGLHRVERQTPVLMASDILTLPDLQCYVRLPGGYPVTRLNFAYRDTPVRARAFVARVPGASVATGRGVCVNEGEVGEVGEVGDAITRASAQKPPSAPVDPLLNLEGL